MPGQKVQQARRPRNNIEFPVHVRRSAGFSIEPFKPGRLLKLLPKLRFDGPSLALLPAEPGKKWVTAHCGVDEANKALLASRVGVEEAVAKGGGGLLLVQSHSQTLKQFEQHARTLSILVAKSDDAATMLREASLLLLNNNAAAVLNVNNIELSQKTQAWKWPLLYGNALPWRIRMLVITSINFGYYCGELAAIASLSSVLSHFPWVLYFSGPDSLPTVYGLRRFRAMLQMEMEEQLRTSSRGYRGRAGGRVVGRPALFCEQFPAYPGLLRVRMDHFLFVPARANATLWDDAASDCIQHGSVVPEQHLAYAFRAHNLTMWWTNRREPYNDSTLPLPQGYVSQWSKLRKNKPHPTGMVWHSHNETCVEEWLVRQELTLQGTLGNATKKPRGKGAKEDSRESRAVQACATHHGQERLDGENL